MASTALAGYIGIPTAVNVAPRSMKRIQNAIFDSEQRHSEIDRRIEFQAVETMGGDNITQVTIESQRIDGRSVGEVIRIVYRNGRFKKATSEYAKGPTADLTLGDALRRVRVPVASHGN